MFIIIINISMVEISNGLRRNIIKGLKKGHFVGIYMYFIHIE